ncbi:MAG: cobalamin-dependent protein [Actinomycetota bacterium]
MVRVAFAHPLILAQSPDEQGASSPYFPLGLLYLAGYVREQGHEVAVHDATFDADESAFCGRLADLAPAVVGISAVVTNRELALRFAEIAAATGAVVILGGPDPTMNPEAYLVSEFVDLVVHHEGEQTIAHLLDLVDAGALTAEVLDDVPGIAFRRNGRVHVNQPRPPIENLDELPLPARDLIDMDRYLHQWEQTNGYSSITIATTRGCPYGCDWCRDAVHGDGFRQRSPESVAAEVKQLKDTYGVDSIRIVDDVDGIERGWLEAWADAAVDLDGVVPFEPLNQLQRIDIPLLEVRDSL